MIIKRKNNFQSIFICDLKVSLLLFLNFKKYTLTFFVILKNYHFLRDILEKLFISWVQLCKTFGSKSSKRMEQLVSKSGSTLYNIGSKSSQHWEQPSLCLGGNFWSKPPQN